MQGECERHGPNGYGPMVLWVIKKATSKHGDKLVNAARHARLHPPSPYPNPNESGIC
jgi:hypothetical protein